MLVSLAWKNLWRNKLRSAVIITAIAIGIIGGVISNGLMTGMADQRINSAIANEVSNIQIQNPRFLLNHEIQYTLPSKTNWVEALSKYPEVKGVSSRLDCQAMASSASAGAGITAFGIVPADEQKVSDIHKHLIAGEYLNNSQRLPALIGKKLAKKLDLGMGDRLIVTLSDTSGTITSGAFKIVGIYKTSNDLFDAASVFVRKKDLAAILSLSPNTTHQVAIRLKDNIATDRLVNRLNKEFKTAIDQKQILIRSWKQIDPLLQSMIDMMNMFSYIFMMVILVALAFGIVNTMVMAIMERTREIGMLMALGLNKKKTFTMIMLETIFLSLVGAIVGLVVSLLIVHHYALTGFDLSAMGKGMNSIGYSAIVFFRVDTDFYVTTVFMVAIIAIISAISPARKALKLQPATAIRENNL
jgi:putative ABC transport system permease protein